ncbi:MAG: TrbG/VirB9 family P-type conjugative transfer protein [Proteobacteria bacterium]|nr:TrbG/VirB9 family P-type conjugative transfer protein [Pseudomonadota bacterium]
MIPRPAHTAIFPILAQTTSGIAIGLLLSGSIRADPRVRSVDYEPNEVVPLTAFVGYHVHVEFGQDEQFVNLAAGDTAALDVGAEGNHLLLKPRAAAGPTNLTVLTNRRTYFFEYRALARAPRADEAVYSIAFRYRDARPATLPVGSPDADSQLQKPRPVANRDYWYCGDPALRPLAAVDDGLQLRLTFADYAEWPAVYASEADGTESLVNYHVEGGAMILHRLAARFVLRRGKEVGCVVNRGSREHGSRPSSGTTDPGISRELREPVR